MTSAVLHLQNVQKSYGRLVAVKGIDLDVRPAEIVGLLGPNGAGKSTLFQIAAGLLAGDTGTVELFGLSYYTHRAEILARLGVVFQSRSLDLDMTVLASLRFHGRLFGLAGRKLEDRIVDIADLLEIGDLLKKPARALSGGNQRRIEIGRALLNAPDLLLMDEPTTGLDVTMRRRVVEHMHRVRARGTSILWATHLVEEVDQANRVLLIHQGSIVQHGTPADLMTESRTATLADAYVALTGPIAAKTS